MANGTSVMKEFHRLVRHADKLYDGQVELELNDEVENTSEVVFFLIITPNDGLYKNARCKFKVTVDNCTYPDQPPEVKCLTAIYHPNIDIGNLNEGTWGDICVSLLDDDWVADVGLEGCVQAVLFLFYNPELDDALSRLCHDLCWGDFESNLYCALRGGEIDTVKFDRLIIEGNMPKVLNEGTGTDIDATQDTNDKENVAPKSDILNTESRDSDDITVDEPHELNEQNKSEWIMINVVQGTGQSLNIIIDNEGSETGDSDNVANSGKEPQELVLKQDTISETKEQEMISCAVNVSNSELEVIESDQCQYYNGAECTETSLQLQRQSSTDNRKSSILKAWFIKVKAGISLLRRKCMVNRYETTID